MSQSSNIMFYIQASGLLFLVIGGILGIELYQGQKPAEVTLASIQVTPEKDDDIYSCEEDLDCMSVPVACCDCEEGGEKQAINRKYLTYILNKQQDECIFTACPQRLSDDLTCTVAQPRCEQNKCVMK